MRSPVMGEGSHMLATAAGDRYVGNSVAAIVKLAVMTNLAEMDDDGDD